MPLLWRVVYAASGRSLRDIAAELAAAGYVNERGRRYNPKSVASMLAVRMGEGAR